MKAGGERRKPYVVKEAVQSNIYFFYSVSTQLATVSTAKQKSATPASLVASSTTQFSLLTPTAWRISTKTTPSVFLYYVSVLEQ